MPRDYDVIIIGSGIGGITTGLYLARAGLRVLICEQRKTPGGLLTATRHGQHLLDVRLPCFCSQGVAFSVLQELGIQPSELFVRADWQINTPSMQIRLDSLQNVFYKLQGYFPNELVALRDYFNTIEELIQWLKDAFQPHPEMQAAWGKIGKVGQALIRPRMTVKAVQAMLISTPQFLRQYFTDARLIHILTHLGYPEMPALLHAGMWYLFLEEYWLPKKGLYGVVEVLTDAFRIQSGSLFLNTRVERIVIKDRQAQGVQLDTGEKIFAHFIISAVDYRYTYRSLVDESVVTQHFLRKLNTRQPSESYVTLCLGTDLSEQTLGRCSAVHTFHFPEQGLINGMLISVPRLETYSESAQAPWQPVYLSYQCTGVTHVETVYAQLIKTAGKMIAGLEKHILFSEVWHPNRYEQEFGVFSGASAGWRLHPEHMLRRGFPGWKSPINNLYHASQWTYSPGGVPAAMLSARQVSRHIIGTREREPRTESRGEKLV
jgi:phytoene dehydrogenase-like protein